MTTIRNEAEMNAMTDAWLERKCPSNVYFAAAFERERELGNAEMMARSEAHKKAQSPQQSVLHVGQIATHQLQPRSEA